MFSDVGRFPGMVEQHLDRPLEQMAEQAARSAHAAGESLKGGIEHAVMGAGAALELLPALVIEFVENPIVAAAAAAIEAMEKAFDFIKDGISEVSSKPLKLSLEAEKSGVSVEFFSRLSEAARTVEVSIEQLGTGFKLMQKNAVDAVQGTTPQAARAFTDIGISAGWLSKHLGDNEAIWRKVQERIGSLPTAAERTHAALELLGKSGADLVPVLSMSAEHMQKLGDVAERLGAVETAESARMGKEWKEMTVQFEEAWEGMKRKLLEPFMEVIAKNWETKFLPVLMKLADAIGKLIPVALEAMKDAFVGLEPIIEAFAQTIELMLRGLAKLNPFGDGTSPIADALQQGREAMHDFTAQLNGMHFDGKDDMQAAPKDERYEAAREAARDVIIQLNGTGIYIDPDKAADQLAKQLAPHIQEAVRKHNQGMEKSFQSQRTADRVSRALGS